jgi:chemosensory pili system protein ChpA (sensor histidine kinase/response regulator)
MNENASSFDENELTTEDLDILKAFEAIESWPADNNTSAPTTGPSSNATYYRSAAEKEQAEVIEMLMIFLEEAGEDIGKMRQACNQIIQSPQLVTTRFGIFQRAGHKLRGTAAAVGYPIMSLAAEQIESIAEQIMAEKVDIKTGFQAIESAVTVLEYCHQQLSEDGQEPSSPNLLSELEAHYNKLGIQIIHQNSPAAASVVPAHEENKERGKTTTPLDPTTISLVAVGDETEKASSSALVVQPEASSAVSFMHIETRRFENLLHHTEHLVELHASLENAQKEVRLALQNQQTAQTRLQQLEQALSNLLLDKHPAPMQPDQTSSSLIARILNNAEQTPARTRRSKNRPRQQPEQQKEGWDVLNMESYSEKDLLLRALREAIVQQSICTTRVNTVAATLQQLQQEYMARVILVRSDTQLMRLTPLSALVPKIQRVIEASALAQQYPVYLDVSGENLEIDQEILEALTAPLVAMLDSCTSDTSVIKEDQEQQKPCHVGFHARGNGNDITIEISFSMPVLGGAFEILQKPLQKFNGSLTSRRNPSGWVSFYLSIPRSQGTVPCLLIRVGEQQYIVPMSQIQRVNQQSQEKLPHNYELRKLLDQPTVAGSNIVKDHAKPLLVIQSPTTHKSVGIIVDEIISEQELIPKPLPPFMQRPGIKESAVDGQGNVLLLVDITELIAGDISIVSSNKAPEEVASQAAPPKHSVPKILLADDSAYLRQRVLQTLQRAHYEVMEAKDGMEAIEQLLENTPDIFLLDIEMPNLNGYDVLTVIREYPELARVKTIMLTSRTSEKHKQRARELGAQAYLPKPCPQEILLKTISELLAQSSKERAPS